MPGSGRATAFVYAMNYLGKLGHPAARSFRLGPHRQSMKAAVRTAIRRARIRSGKVRITVICPPAGSHCRNHLTLKSGHRTYTSRHFQMAPGSINRVRIRIPASLHGMPLSLKLTAGRILGSDSTASRRLR